MDLVLLSRCGIYFAGRPSSGVKAIRCRSYAGQLVRKWETVSGASLHAGHREGVNFFMRNRCFRSGACPDLSWNSMAACRLGSPAMSPAKLSEGRGGSMCLILSYLGELFHMFDAVFKL
jgi:hypothetical protein